MPAELPPHARRIPGTCRLDQDVAGTTSACAENTSRNSPVGLQCRNYLRMRGEYSFMTPATVLVSELPPHARRILLKVYSSLVVCGTTSACAENTRGRQCDPGHVWNYLRVRGEYRFCHEVYRCFEELPPRARRIRGKAVQTSSANGTTSACAENTVWRAPRSHPRWNYLRVRGEYR